MADYHRRYGDARNHLQNLVDAGEMEQTDQELAFEFVDAYDRRNNAIELPNGKRQHHLKRSTLATYLRDLGYWARWAPKPLFGMTPKAINCLADGLFSGDHPAAPDGGYAQNTLNRRQLSLRKFYRYHRIVGRAVADPDSIDTIGAVRSTVDKTELFDRDEIHRMRDEATHPRDLALLDMFLYTGQRLTAIQTLRIKDLNIQEGRYRLNPEFHEGLKGADQVGDWRPLLLAKSSVAAWIQQHPVKRKRDAFLFTHKPEYMHADPGTMLTDDYIRDVLKSIGDDAGVRKPLNPHNFRHTFVTIAFIEHDLDKDTIRRLIGHDDGSNVMEITYKHLDDADYIEKAEVAMGLRDKKPKGSLTPDTCPTCHEHLPAGAKACARCGLLITPDAQSAKNPFAGRRTPTRGHGTRWRGRWSSSEPDERRD